MRTLLPLLLLACLAYAGWYYWQQYNDQPVRAALLLAAAEDIIRVQISERPNEAAFELRNADVTEAWVVNREHTQLRDQSTVIQNFLTQLTGLETDSIAHNFVIEEKQYVLVVHSTTYGEEALQFALPPEGPALARRTKSGDIFALPRQTVAALLPYLRFDHYREPRLLNLAAAGVDSIVARQRDSLLWQMNHSDSLPVLAQTFIAPASAPYADYFDEIADQEKYYATLQLFANGQPHVVTIFRDSLWPQPYVLVGEDFPRRYLAADTLR
ncbi:MAG: hypothetical protein AAFZ52_14970 [Bacteroidota bacterium]